MTKDEKMTSDTITYLQMIQATIDRMSTSSAIFKGFSATIVAGISAISFSEINQWVLFLSFIPVLCFLILDVYYLRLERRYRFLYEQVRNGNKEIDFDLRPTKVRDILNMDKHANIRVLSCVKSPSILLFYVPMMLISCIVLIMNCGGCI